MKNYIDELIETLQQAKEKGAIVDKMKIHFDYGSMPPDFTGGFIKLFETGRQYWAFSILIDNTKASNNNNKNKKME